MNQDSKQTPESAGARATAVEGSIALTIFIGESGARTYQNDRAFVIGRGNKCDLALPHESLSQRHVEIYPAKRGWWVRDLGSTNGTYVNGNKVQNVALSANSEIQLAVDGPRIRVRLEDQQPAAIQSVSGQDSTNHRDHSSNRPAAENHRPGAHGAQRATPPTHTASEHERLRAAYQRALAKRSKGYRYVIGGLVGVVMLTAVFAGYQFQQNAKSEKDTIALFYTIKTLELDLENLQDSLKLAGNEQFSPDVSRLATRVSTLRRQYDSKAAKLRKRRTGGDREYELIVHVARAFGECEVDVPADFVDEVRLYIAKWQSSNRLSNALSKIQANGTLSLIARTLEEARLPAQFLYLALQESNFDPKAVGIETYAGIAKGAWQFIPATAQEYGLKIGPRFEERVFDPADERFDIERATAAAARYLKSIYQGPAEGSGLLTMAGYNWGHNRIQNRLQKMPEGPSERNFWQLLRHHKIPEETYNYVFMIFSAAVIGEDPGYFGFEFAPPLGELTALNHSAKEPLRAALTEKPAT